MGSVLLFLYRKFVLLLDIICFSLYNYLLPLLFRKNQGAKEEIWGNYETSSVRKIESESTSKQNLGNLFEGLPKNEETENCFQFKFQSYEDFCKNRKENEDNSNLEGLSGFIKETEVLKIEDNKDEPFVTRDIFNEGSSSVNENYEQIKSTEEKIIVEEFPKVTEREDLSEESINSSPSGSFMDRVIGFSSNGFLSDSDFGDNFEFENEDELLDDMPKLYEKEKGKENYSVDEENIFTIEELRKIEEVHYKIVGKSESGFLSNNDFFGDLKKADLENKSQLAKLDLNENNSGNEEDIYTMKELRKIEEAHYKNIGKWENGFCEESENFSKKTETKNKSDWDSDELWEHQELIEQLKMELKKVKATGLPTILEESESPKIADDLKPWKIDEKFQYVDRTGELNKFYKSYRDRMRKLDILNYQKMYAIGFLQLKDPLYSISPQKSSIPSVSTLLSHNIFPCKGKKIGNDPMMKFVIELQSDLEIVYVGHMCLSWEILHWQYGKALELWEADPHNIRMYNEVAGDFQQFQVLMQRFIEDEPFQGPRVQNYVKSRCALRNLLQVPLIKEDNLKNRKKALKRREMGDFAITSDTLIEILEESIRIFWRFIRADKDCSNVTLKSRKGLNIKLQDPADSELLLEVQENLHKKEKKLKDILRGGNCILKKLKKNEEADSDQVLFFFSQVDMKLVGRVLNMPRITTDQLIWCRNKLQKISFVSKKIQVEPSFLLFPC